jgi:ribosome-binding factor A
MATIRQEKVSGLLQRELAQIFQRETSFLPSGVMVTVTVVRASPDLGFAKVYLSLFNAENPKELIKFINDRKGFYKNLLGRSIAKVVRVIPDLQFHIDDSLAYAQKIDELLK